MTRILTLLSICGFEIGLIMVVAACTALAEDPANTYDIMPPPACFNNKGEMVQFENQTAQGANAAAGMAKRNAAGVPVIYRFSYERSPKPLQYFIDLHECAHHQTGDIDRPHPPRNSPAHMMNESIADCIATMRIRDENQNGASLISGATLALKRAMESVGFPASTIDSRLSNINNCMKKDGSAKAFIKAVLEHRGLI